MLRINPLAGTRLADIVDVITGAWDEAGVDHAFVELMYPADDVDRALHICERLMDRRRTL
jgi:hypothetical protein